MNSEVGYIFFGLLEAFCDKDRSVDFRGRNFKWETYTKAQRIPVGIGPLGPT